MIDAMDAWVRSLLSAITTTLSLPQFGLCTALLWFFPIAAAG